MHDEKPSAKTDFFTGIAWLALALFFFVGAWRMDRLAHLQASLYTVPGLVPGLLAAAIGLMAILLIVRGLRNGALGHARQTRVRFADHWRLIAALLLCLGFAIGVLGRAGPFWLGAWAFIALFVFVFRYPERREQGARVRVAAVAAGYGLIAALAIQYVFQDLFLVRLP